MDSLPPSARNTPSRKLLQIAPLPPGQNNSAHTLSSSSGPPLPPIEHGAAAAVAADSATGTLASRNHISFQHSKGSSNGGGNGKMPSPASASALPTPEPSPTLSSDDLPAVAAVAAVLVDIEPLRPLPPPRIRAHSLPLHPDHASEYDLRATSAGSPFTLDDAHVRATLRRNAHKLVFVPPPAGHHADRAQARRRLKMVEAAARTVQVGGAGSGVACALKAAFGVQLTSTALSLSATPLVLLSTFLAICLAVVRFAFFLGSVAAPKTLGPSHYVPQHIATPRLAVQLAIDTAMTAILAVSISAQATGWSQFSGVASTIGATWWAAAWYAQIVAAVGFAGTAALSVRLVFEQRRIRRRMMRRGPEKPISVAVTEVSVVVADHVGGNDGGGGSGV
ncbi:hypothetical protein BC828DRAFT_380790 [Blastocladiella britannica]|nr:hypothetical protein BC828DRAFT_380790 [Blastocladiella britannica]